MDWKRVFMEQLDKETEKFADDSVEPSSIPQIRYDSI